MYVGGWIKTDELDSVPVQLVYKFDTNTTVDPPELVTNTSIWVPRTPYRADVTGLAYNAGYLYVAGNQGVSAWPDFEWYPTLFVTIDGTFPGLGAAWGSGNPDNNSLGSLLLPSGAIAVVGTGTKAEGRWHGTIGEALNVLATVDIFDRTPSPQIHVLVPQEITPQDIYDDLEDSVDRGAGLMEAMLDVILQMGAVIE